MTLTSKTLIAALALTSSSIALAQAAQPMQPSTKATTTKSVSTTQPVSGQTQTTTTAATTTMDPATGEAQQSTTSATATTQPTADGAQTTTTSTTQPVDAVTGEPTAPSQSETTTTTTTSSTGNAATAAATKADIKSGVKVYDTKGGQVGKIQSVTATDAVVATGETRAALPLASFAKNDKGLVIGMTKSEIDASAKKKTQPKSAPKKK